MDSGGWRGSGGRCALVQLVYTVVSNEVGVRFSITIRVRVRVRVRIRVRIRIRVRVSKALTHLMSPD